VPPTDLRFDEPIAPRFAAVPDLPRVYGAASMVGSWCSRILPAKSWSL